VTWSTGAAGARHDAGVTGPDRSGDLGSILAVFAHPDDEAYLAGALMAKAVDEGRRVVCVTATRGELGFPDDDPRSAEERAAVRTAEMAACLGILGVEEHHWLDLPDGGSDEVPDEVPAGRIAELIDEIRPDTTLTFGPDGQTYHVDHIAISRWTTQAVAAAEHPTRLLYAAMTDEWIQLFVDQGVDLGQVMMVPGVPPPTVPTEALVVWFRAEGDLLDRKVRALRAQASQVEPLVQQVGVEAFAAVAADEFYCAPG
jgi:LmbE family N-acetylglucosaminyl deacetylase